MYACEDAIKRSDQRQQSVHVRVCFRRVLAVLVRLGIALLLIGATGCAPAPSTGQADQSPIAGVPPSSAKLTPMDHQSKIDSNLLRAMQQAHGGAAAASPAITTVAVNADGTVDVAVRAMVNDDLVAQIEALGAHVTYTNARMNTIEARVPLDTLEAIAVLPEVRFIVPKPQASTNASDAPPFPSTSASPLP
jgi:hypothetical protein